MQTVVGPHGSENRDQTSSHSSLLPFESELKKINKNTHTERKKQTLNYAPFRVGVDGGKGRLLERTVFVEEIEGTRDSDGGGRTTAAETCV